MLFFSGVHNKLTVLKMSKTDFAIKRIFDVLFSITGLFLLWPFIIICWLIAAIETRSNGFFIQKRIGKNGNSIKVYKIKTMYAADRSRSSITANNISSITISGTFFRKYKLDELPQLLNVLWGSMSFVGPRPDVPGYADKLQGDDRVILRLRPGITGPASIKYRNEENLLLSVADPAYYNNNVIWPDKVKINKYYYSNYSFYSDIKYILKTLVK